MKILEVSHHFLPRHRAGVEVHTDRSARELVRQGAEVEVVTTEDLARPLGTIVTEVERGLRIHRIAHGRAVSGPMDTLASAPVGEAFESILDRFRPEVVHFQHLMYLGLDLPARVRARGLRSILTLHEYWLLCARGGQFVRADGALCERAEDTECARCLASFKFGRSPGEARVAGWCRRLESWTGIDLFPALKRLRERSSAAGPVLPATPAGGMLEFLARRREVVAAVAATVDAVLCPSRFLMSKFVASGWPEEKLRHWPNGVSGVQGGTRRSRPSGPLRLGFIGSLVPAKGIDVLLAAQRRLPRGLATLEVYGAGRGRFAAAVRRDAVPGEVRFRGVFPGGEASSLLTAFDALVVPSVWYENAPLVISEAFAAGVPVVASRLGGMAEAVRDGIDGLHFAPNDPEDLARVLRALATEAGLLERLTAGVRAPRSITAEISDLLSLARELVGASR